MYHFQKKFKNFLLRGAPWKCLGASRECFPGPRWGFRRVCICSVLFCFLSSSYPTSQVCTRVRSNAPLLLTLVVYVIQGVCKATETYRSELNCYMSAVRIISGALYTLASCKATHPVVRLALRKGWRWKCRLAWRRSRRSCCVWAAVERAPMIVLAWPGWASLPGNWFRGPPSCAYVADVDQPTASYCARASTGRQS